jgi:hypothetical protein
MKDPHRVMRGYSEIERKGPREFPKIPRVQALLADREEPAVVAPRVAGNAPDQVEAAPAAEPIEAGHVAVTAGADPTGAERYDRELLLLVRVLGPEREEFGERRRTEVHGLQVLLDLLGRGRTREADEAEFHVRRPLARDREVRGHDVLVLPVVAAGLDHVFERLPVVDRHREPVLLEELVKVLRGSSGSSQP